MSENKLESTSGIHGAVNLRELDLSFNMISSIEGLGMTSARTNKRILGSLANLETLRLSNNKLNSSTNFSELRDLGNLKILDLSYNVISEIPCRDIPGTVRSLDFRGNPACNKPRYREDVLSNFPGLIYLDDAPANMVTWSLDRRVDDMEYESFIKNEQVDDAKLASLRLKQQLFYKTT